ncbi:MAG: hypothetical protein ACR2KJ_09995 [Jatrophihabitans sp.]
MLTFAAPTPATGWGFSLGDIDAESVRIIPLDADGNDLPVSVLGYQGSFDYDASDNATDGVDLPTWNAGAGLLSGHGTMDPTNKLNDTRGGVPLVRADPAPLRAALRVDEPHPGSPQWQLWIAARTASVTGKVETPAGEPVPNAIVELETPAGDPLPGSPDAPTQVKTDEQGVYVFPAAVRQPVVVVVLPPAHDTAVGVIRRPVDLTARDVAVAPFVLRVPPAPAPSTKPTTTATSAASSSGIGLANTGAHSGGLSVVAVLALLSGGLILVAARRPRGRHG